MDSSPSIPSRPNPKPRNSETGDLMRRSFRASPFPGKNSTGDKENRNDKDVNSDVVKAPKASKNFMSPTISAVSKINPSPRKKILSEKNELSRSFDKTHHHHHPQVRSSVTFSDVVSFIGEEDKDKDQIFIGEKKKLDDDVTVTDMDDSSFDVSPPLPTSVGPFTFLVFEEAREVDASVTPYDPKKNYLSPRPQFLHYRPNPRVECKQLDELFSSESSSTDTDLSAEESQQEEEVASEEGVEEEVASQEIVEEEAEESQQVEEVVVSVEEEAEVTLDENDDEEHLEAVESEEEEEVVVGESTEETHEISKQSRFKTSKLFGWILVLGVALLVSSVTLTLPNISEGSHFYKFHIPPEITKPARESFEQFSEKLGMWAGSSLVYMDKLISSLREEEAYGPFQFHNLTSVLEETRLSDAVFQPTSRKISVAGSLMDSLDWSFGMDTETENGVHQEYEEPENGVNQEPENSGKNNLEAVYEEGSHGLEQESEGGEFNSEMVYGFDKQTEIATDTEVNVGEVYSESLSEGEEESGGQETDGVEEQREFEENDQKNLEEGHESETRSAQNDEKMMEESESNAQLLDDVESAAISDHQQEETSPLANPESVQEEVSIEETAETSLDISAETSDVDGHDMEEESGIATDMEEVVTNAEDWKEMLMNNQKKVMVLVSTLMVIVAAAAAFLLANKKAKPVVQEDGEPTTIPDAKEVNFEPAPVENLIKEGLSKLNFQEEKEEVNDDRKREEVSSFPSEMSFSSHKDKSLRSCSNRDEYQSGGGGRKSNDSGESMASSASEYSIGGSVSYGSFTTYEKIQKRSGRKEEEMVTPVRRSSRIRNHQHSGQ